MTHPQHHAQPVDDLLAELLAERFPTATQVRAEARRPIPAPPITIRGTAPVTVDTMRRDATDALRFESRREAADARRIEARIAAARKIVAASRRKAG